MNAIVFILCLVVLVFFFAGYGVGWVRGKGISFGEGHGVFTVLLGLVWILVFVIATIRMAIDSLDTLPFPKKAPAAPVPPTAAEYGSYPTHQTNR